jgi:hypothetical protein
MLKEIRPFFVSIFTQELNLDNDSIRDGILEEHRNNPTSVSISNEGGWQSDSMDLFSTCSSTFMKPLLTVVCDNVKQVSDTMGVTSKLAPSYWFNINKRYNYNQ